MNRYYRVRIKGVRAYFPYMEAVESMRFTEDEKRRLAIELNAGETHCADGVMYCIGFGFITESEEKALEVYAKAKRNLDLKKFIVTLEFPGKEEK